MKLRQLRQTHPEYEAGEWKKARALYAGGKKLLADKKLLEEIFPRHLAEADIVYQNRVKRAFYIPYLGEAINQIVAGVFKVKLDFAVEDGELDDFYEDFFEDCSPPGGATKSFNDMLRSRLLSALLTKCSWVLVDFPKKLEGINSLADEEEYGLDRPYLCAIESEDVLDWECNPVTGEFLWVCIRTATAVRTSPQESRDIVDECFTIWYPDHWERYQITYNVKEPPDPETDVELVESMPHAFGQVPIVRLDLGEDLWAADKVLSVCVAHFNLRNALSWAEYKSLFPVPVAFMDMQNPLNPATDDPTRAQTQTYGQGYMPIMAAGDRIEYIGPDSQPYAIALQDLAGLRDEIHRVLMQMANAVDNSGAALKRSGESKSMDMALTAVLLKAYAADVTEFGLRILRVVEQARGDEPTEWKIIGLDGYEESTVDGLLEQAAVVDAVSIPSATFKRAWCYSLASRLLGPAATQEMLGDIRKELEQNVTNEEYTMAAQLALEAPTDSEKASPVPERSEEAPPKPARKPRKARSKDQPV
jgi:hypothetical protein